MATKAHNFLHVEKNDVNSWDIDKGEVQNVLRTITNSMFSRIKGEYFESHTVWCTKSQGGEANFSLNERAPALPNFLRELFSDYSKMEHEAYAWAIVEPSERCPNRYAWHLTKPVYMTWKLGVQDDLLPNEDVLSENTHEMYVWMQHSKISTVWTKSTSASKKYYSLNNEVNLQFGANLNPTIDTMFKNLLTHTQLYREK